MHDVAAQDNHWVGKLLRAGRGVLRYSPVVEGSVNPVHAKLPEFGAEGYITARVVPEEVRCDEHTAGPMEEDYL